MTKIYPHILPDIEDWPINKLSLNRAHFVTELKDYSVEKFNSKSDKELEAILASTIYLEKNRIKTDPWKVDPPQELQYWNKIGREFEKNLLSENKTQFNQELLIKITNRYSEEIVSNFNPKTFRFARKVLTTLFKRLFNTASGNKEQLFQRFNIVGDVEQVRRLMTKGTVVIVPTHFSNLDSIIIGYALDTVVGVPAFSYGAGLNLFDYELIAYFMNRLGAYKLDRRKKNPIYLQTLKSFSALSAKKGINSIFFPGGTRSRNGKIEDKVKLGLLGTLIEAQRKLCLEEKDKKIYIVPLVIGYHFVLEADSLINQYLKKTGKEKYLKSNVKPTGWRKVSGFIWDLLYEDSELSLSFGNAMDVFGNSLDEEGRSFDASHREIQMEDYFKTNDAINEDLQRERIYTQKLGRKIISSFFKNNVVLSSHLMAHIAFAVHKVRNPKVDIYTLLSLPLDVFEIKYDQMIELVKVASSHLMQLAQEEKVRLSPVIKESPEKIIKNGLSHLGAYHNQKPLVLTKKNLFLSEDFKTLYYYHNRLEGYNLFSVIEKAIK